MSHDKIIRCGIKGCKKRIVAGALKAGQTILYTEKVEAYCSEKHWEQHLKEVLPHHWVIEVKD